MYFITGSLTQSGTGNYFLEAIYAPNHPESQDVASIYHKTRQDTNERKTWGCDDKKRNVIGIQMHGKNGTRMVFFPRAISSK
ncbi:MAG: hypothetical protein OEV93_00130 [Candidatus Moranbacteria bacterium]|nr:hypothetical protein [Candidatus Moranbacteria bacterium]